MARTNSAASLSRSIQSHLARQKSVAEVRMPFVVEGRFGAYPQLGGGEAFMVVGVNGEMLVVQITLYRHGI